MPINPCTMTPYLQSASLVAGIGRSHRRVKRSLRGSHRVGGDNTSIGGKESRYRKSKICTHKIKLKQILGTLIMRSENNTIPLPAYNGQYAGIKLLQPLTLNSPAMLQQRRRLFQAQSRRLRIDLVHDPVARGTDRRIHYKCPRRCHQLHQWQKRQPNHKVG